MKPLTFKKLRKTNLKRCEKHFHKLTDWSTTDWACALAGEVGEYCNFIKKIRRLMSKKYVHNAGEQYEELRQKAGKELADIQAYLDLNAARLGFDLDKLTISKFNEVSKRVGAKYRL